MDNKTPVHNSTYPKGGVSCSKDSFVVNESLVFQIEFCELPPQKLDSKISGKITTFTL